MGDYSQIQLDLPAIEPATQDRQPLTEDEIMSALSSPIGQTSGVSRFQFDAEGHAIEVSNEVRSQSVNTGIQSPSSIYAAELNGMREQMARLQDQFAALEMGDPMRDRLRREMQQLEKRAKDLKAKELQAINTGEAERVREKDATLSRLNADLAATETDARERKLKARKRR